MREFSRQSPCYLNPAHYLKKDRRRRAVPVHSESDGECAEISVRRVVSADEAPRRNPGAANRAVAAGRIESGKVLTIFDQVRNLKHLDLLQLIYSTCALVKPSGLIEDIDSDRGLIRLGRAKGKKNRYATLSKLALRSLAEFIRQYCSHDFLLSGPEGGRISHSTVYRMFLRVWSSWRAPQARDGANAETFVCHASLGERHRPAPYPGTYRTHQFLDNRVVHAPNRASIGRIVSPLERIPKETDGRRMGSTQ
jgi:hypothetical protein